VSENLGKSSVTFVCNVNSLYCTTIQKPNNKAYNTKATDTSSNVLYKRTEKIVHQMKLLRTQ